MKTLYEWDEAKAAANLAKHGVSFDDAADALDDPWKVEHFDDRFDYGEERMRTICMVSDGTVLYVVTVMRGHACRIITARKANRREQQSYFQNRPPHA